MHRPSPGATGPTGPRGYYGGCAHRTLRLQVYASGCYARCYDCGAQATFLGGAREMALRSLATQMLDEARAGALGGTATYIAGYAMPAPGTRPLPPR